MKTYKVKLMFDNAETFGFWVEQLRLVRDCWNFASKIVFEEKIPLGIKQIHNRLYRAEREAFPALPSQICISVNRAILSSYKAIRSNKQKMKEAAQMRNASLQIDKRIYSNLRPDSFKISSGKANKREEVKFLTYPKFDELMASLRPCDPKLQLDEEKNVIYACFPFIELPPIQRDDSCLGIDLGCRRLATTSDGIAYTDKDYLARRRKIRHNKRIFQSHRKKSHSARRKLRKLKRKEYFVSKEMCNLLSNQILKTDKSVLVLEDLTKIKQNTSRTPEGFKRKKHNNRLGQVPFYLLKQMLGYKALRKGKIVVTVSPEYTSQIDSRTGSREGCLRKGCRFYTATKGVVYDADWNASLNIRNRHLKRLLSSELPLDGKLDLVGSRFCQRTNGRSKIRQAQ